MEFTEPKTGISICAAKLKVQAGNLWNAKHISQKELNAFNELIEELDNIHDSLEFYDNHPLYLLLHRELHRLFRQQVPIYSFIIKINLRPGNHVPALLTFDLFPQEKSLDYTPENFS